MSVGELAMTPRISLVAVCCSNACLSSWNSRTLSLRVALSRCKDSASCWRSSAIVACLAGDVFTTGRRGFGFVTLLPFLVLVAIQQTDTTEILVAGRNLNDWGRLPPRLS